MARDVIDNAPIENSEALSLYLAAGGKPKASWRLGTEHEKFPFYRRGNRPVPYSGPRGIGALLAGLQAAAGWQPIMDSGNIIGLAGEPGQGAISLEPGGQFELSGAPLANIHQTEAELQAHLAQLRPLAAAAGIGFLGLGASPLWSLAETPAMPKSRYKIMAEYMPKTGADGLNMMFRTATAQVNLDFADEADMRRKMRLAMQLQPLATALFAASPFTEGRPNGLLSWRSDIWRDTDKARCGLLPFVFAENFGFADYAEWALNVPMYFVLRRGRYFNAAGATFRQFLAGALKTELTEAFSAAEAEPVMSDWINHLSTLFPEVRLKRFIEMRGADSGPPAHIPALAAFWAGLLYDETALNEAEALAAGWSYAEVLALREIAPAQGLQAQFRRRRLQDWARDILAIARRGLQNRARRNAAGEDETKFLAPLEAIAISGKTVAEQMLSRYNSAWGRSVAPVFRDYVW